jgi:hypothetical protein
MSERPLIDAELNSLGVPHAAPPRRADETREMSL